MELETLSTPENRIIAATAAAAIGVGTIYFIWRASRRRRARAALHDAIRAVGFDYLQDVLVPDGMGGSMHVDYLLLTSRGVLVIDLRDIAGNIFGGDQMTEWTVMDGPRRTTFVNPQSGLYDRIASVKALTQDAETPVEGRIVFTRRAKFPKGLPRYAVMLESIAAEFPKLGPAELEQAVSRYRPAWLRVKEACRPSPHVHSSPIAVA